MSDKKIDNTSNSYGDDAIVTLSPREHIRLRPGMYIGKLGDGSQADDGIYRNRFRQDDGRQDQGDDRFDEEGKGCIGRPCQFDGLHEAQIAETRDD